jgi:hypothetical protein
MKFIKLFLLSIDIFKNAKRYTAYYYIGNMYYITIPNLSTRICHGT